MIVGLPQSSGVYIFRDEKGTPLYVGKSVNIRNKVLSHFTQNALSVKESALSRLVAVIEAIPTSGKLGALLHESRLIKELSPLYNRQGCFRKNVTIIRCIRNEHPYHSVKIDDMESISPADLSDVLGIFRSVKAARDFLWDIAKEHSFCPNVLGLESGKKACVYSQIGRCKGACKGAESPRSFNLRFEEAFHATRIKRWPFLGPVLLQERMPGGDEGEAFIIDNWCLLAIFSFDEFSKRRILRRDYIFDYDAYKIMTGFLLKPEKRFTLKELSRNELREILEDQ